jgi:hypothetical protein
MKLGLTEKQYNNLVSLLQEQAEPPASEPEKGTSDKQTGGQGYPEVGKWESGATRGPGNQIGVTKWADVVGSKLTRGKSNPLKEQKISDLPKGKTTVPSIKDILRNSKTPEERNSDILKQQLKYPKGGPGSGSDTIADWGKKMQQDRLNIVTGVRKNVYKTEDGNGFIVNLLVGNLSSALLDAREFFLDTELGIGTELFIGIGLAPFGGTAAIEVLNGAFLLNDISVFLHNRDSDPENYIAPKGLTEWDSFIWLCENNEDFQRSCIDALFLLGGYAIGKVEGKVIANRMRKLVGNGTVRKFASLMRRSIIRLYKIADKAPKKLSDFIRNRIDVYERFCQFLERLGERDTKFGMSTKLISTVLPGMTITVFLTLYLFLFGWKSLMLLFNFTKEEIASLRKKKVTPQMEQKVNIVLNGTNIKKDLITNKIDTLGTNTSDIIQKGEHVVDSIIVNHLSEFEEMSYNTLKKRNMINCDRNEFKTLQDKTSDGSSQIYVIKNVKYFINDEDKLEKYKK